MHTSVHTTSGLTFILFQSDINSEVRFRTVLYTSERLKCAFDWKDHRVSALSEAAAAAGSSASIMDLAAIIKSAPASMAVLALPP